MSGQIRLFLEWTRNEIIQGHTTPVRPDVNLKEPVAEMTREEEKHADEVMKVFREEDRFV